MRIYDVSSSPNLAQKLVRYERYARMQSSRSPSVSPLSIPFRSHRVNKFAAIYCTRSSLIDARTPLDLKFLFFNQRDCCAKCLHGTARERSWSNFVNCTFPFSLFQIGLCACLLHILKREYHKEAH